MNSIKKPVILLTIRVVAKNYVKPEKIQEFIVLCKKLVEESVKGEGCIDYGLYQELDNPGILTILEEWRDKSNLDKHLKSKHFREIFPLLLEYLEKETEINIYKKKF
jgi:quinol monooxygenase YgiN